MRVEVANDAELAELQRHFGRSIPDAYLKYLIGNQEMLRDDGLLLYGASAVIERNVTLGVQRYVHDFLAVGDDSGGQLVVIRFDDDSSTPFLIDGGALVPNMPPEFLEPLATSWESWAKQGFPLP